MPNNEKMTAPIPAVGADGEQSSIKRTDIIIAKENKKINRRSGSLDTISMTELYDTAYPPKSVIIEDLLFAGTYLFVGAPKIGKSFFMAQLSYHVATGENLWTYAIHPGEVLYLALEDDFARIQKRLYKMFGTEETEHLHFATESRTLNGGLTEQLEAFIREHLNTKLIIVDTLQRVREIGGDKCNYVCNGCKERNGCKLRRHIYDAKFAQNEYETVCSESRQGFATEPAELRRIDDIISPLVKQGQSIHQICTNNADIIMLDERTIYNYIDAGLLSVGNLDLPRKVRYRARKKKKPLRVDKQCHLGRTYEDFLDYMKLHPDIPVVEMDSVEGKKGGKVLLTLFFRNCNLMLAYIRDTNTARSVTEIIEGLYQQLGREAFCRLLPVILTDRGSEFTDPVALECDEWGEVRTRVFYCDPQRSDQKGGIEVTHEFIRRILPKGTSFNNLTQDDISLMMSHINSYTRKKLNNRSAHQLFSFFYGDDILAQLNLSQIPANDINLTPKLLKK